MKHKALVFLLALSLLLSCKKDDDDSSSDVRQESIDVLFYSNNENAIHSGKVDTSQFEVMYIKGGNKIPYPHSSDVFKHGFQIVDVEGEKVVRIHLDASEINGSITLFKRSYSVVDTIKADFIKTASLVKYSKIWYNNNLKYNSENGSDKVPRIIQVEIN